jgi:5-methylcytosine-specific restriction endonuclease McrA
VSRIPIPSSLGDALEQLVSRVVYVPPAAAVERAIGPDRRSRLFRLQDLPTAAGICAWCRKGVLKSRRHKYCTPACGSSAFFYCYPQAPETKMWRLLELQGGACKACGELREEELISLIVRRLEVSQSHWDRHSPQWARFSDVPPRPTRVSYRLVGDNTGHLWQSDHVVPIFRGGAGFGLENVQVLCAPCHNLKTAAERPQA